MNLTETISQNTVERYKNELKENTSHQAKRTIELLEKKGLPTKKWEDWKYTQVLPFLPSSLEQTKFNSADQEKVKAFIENVDQSLQIETNKLILINGKYQENFSSLEEDISFTGIKCSKDQEESLEVFNHINLSFLTHKNKIVIKNSPVPLVIFHFFVNGHKEKSLHERLEVKTHKDSSSTIIEYFIGLNQNDQKSLRTYKSHFSLEDSSKLTHIKIIDEEKNICHISSTHADVNLNANFFDFTLPINGAMTRCNFTAKLTEKYAHCTSNGLFALKDKDHFDIFSNIVHQTGDTTSSQLYKGVLRDQSHGVFTGKVYISRDSNGCDSNQLNKNLLIGDKAQIHTRPQLEVYSDDVKCAHGATTGQLGEEELFYLKSRGIEESRAYNMLTNGFINDVISTIDHKEILNFIADTLIKKSQVSQK